MSRASEWAKRVKEQEAEARLARQGRPATICLVLSPSATIEVETSQEGRALVKIGNGRDDSACVDADKVIEFARKLIATFGEGPSA